MRFYKVGVIILNNRSLSLQFFLLILIIFLAELAAAILAFIFREHVSKHLPNLKRFREMYVL